MVACGGPSGPSYLYCTKNHFRHASRAICEWHHCWQEKACQGSLAGFLLLQDNHCHPHHIYSVRHWATLVIACQISRYFTTLGTSIQSDTVVNLRESEVNEDTLNMVMHDIPGEEKFVSTIRAIRKSGQLLHDPTHKKMLRGFPPSLKN